jgi:amino acid transporter
MARGGAPSLHLGIDGVSSEGLRRDIGLVGLVFTSEGSIIGSGWLFSALAAVVLAGPSALFSWMIGTSIVLLLALVFAELASTFPLAGAMTRFPHFAFGSLAGGVFGWFTYIQAATVAPIEVLAALEYLSGTSWGSVLYDTHTKGLTSTGIVVAIIMCSAFVVINLVGIRWAADTNSVLTTWKVLVPVVTICVILLAHGHWGNLTSHGFFLKGPNGGFHAVLATAGSGAVVFGLIGFEQAVQLAGESRNPQRDIPRALIGALLLGATIYVLVQLSFIVGIDPLTLSHAGSWQGLANDPALARSPFLTLTELAGIAWLAWVIRIDAVISPTGTALIYQTTSSRIMFGLARNGYLPKAVDFRTRVSKVPVVAVVSTTIIGVLFLLPFPSWTKLVGVASSATVLMYASAPLSLGALRHSVPEIERVFRLPAARVLAPLSFACANLIVYWAGWSVISTLMASFIIWMTVWAITVIFNLSERHIGIDWGAAVWLVPYFAGLLVMAYLGRYGSGPIFDGIGPFAKVLRGGDHFLPADIDLLIDVVFSFAIYYLAVARRLPSEVARQHIAEVYPPAADEAVR